MRPSWHAPLKIPVEPLVSHSSPTPLPPGAGVGAGVVAGVGPKGICGQKHFSSDPVLLQNE